MTIVLSSLALSGAAHGGGAWLPESGHGTLYTGFSRKTAHTSWDAYGTVFDNSGRFENHDFRYFYLDGEVGLSRRFAVTFLLTYLDGREGPTGALRRNAGPSDAWIGVKVRLSDGDLKSALVLSTRTSELYDVDGPYSSELHDEGGRLIGYSPEWRGLLKEDYTLAAVASRSYRGGRDWASGSLGYTYRVGAPADQVPVALEGGRWLARRRLAIKLDTLWVLSLGNDSARRPDDRFGARAEFNFNDASMGRVGASFVVPLGGRRRWSLTGGYNVWVWGRSARQYEEPFVSVGRVF